MVVRISIDDYYNNHKLTEFGNFNVDIFGAVQRCKNCRLHLLKVNEQRPFDKERLDKKDVMVVAQNPSHTRRDGGHKIFEVEENINDLCLMNAMKHYGYKRDDYYVTNIIKCSVEDNQFRGALDIQDISDGCISYFLQEVGVIEPKLIIVVGSVASKIIIDNKLDVKFNVKFIKHPSYFLRVSKKLERATDLLIYEMRGVFNE